MAETYFFFDHSWGAETDGPVKFGWAIARKREGMQDDEYGSYEIAGPYPNYADALSAWQGGAVRG